MTAARDLVDAVTAAGGKLIINSGKLRLTAPYPLPDDLIGELRRAKAAHAGAPGSVQTAMLHVFSAVALAQTTTGPAQRPIQTIRISPREPASQPGVPAPARPAGINHRSAAGFYCGGDSFLTLDLSISC